MKSKASKAKGAAPRTKRSAGSQQRVVKRRLCNWMMEAKNWSDCGRIATVIDPMTRLAYCKTHAHYAVEMFGTRAVKPLNTKLTDSRE